VANTHCLVAVSVPPEIRYDVEFRSNILNTYLGIAGRKVYSIPEATLHSCCGRLCEEMLAFIVLMELGVNMIDCAGWICRCHLCRPLPCNGLGSGCVCRLCTVVHPQRRAMAVLWEQRKLIDGCDQLTTRCHRIADAFTASSSFDTSAVTAQATGFAQDLSASHSLSKLGGAVSTSFGIPGASEMTVFDGCRCPDCVILETHGSFRCGCAQTKCTTSGASVSEAQDIQDAVAWSLGV